MTWKSDIMTLKQRLQEAAVAVEDCRRKLAQAEQLYDSLFKQAVGGTRSKRNVESDAPPIVNVNGSASSNFTERILTLLATSPQREWLNSEIQKQLPDVPKSTLPSLLYRLGKANKIVKTGYGKWKYAAM